VLGGNNKYLRANIQNVLMKPPVNSTIFFNVVVSICASKVLKRHTPALDYFKYSFTFNFVFN
jgi:hypothetical protein